MSRLSWYKGKKTLPISTARSIQSAHDEITETNPIWVVLVRVESERGERPTTAYYAFRRGELTGKIKRAIVASHGSEPVEFAMGLSESDASRTVRGPDEVRRLDPPRVDWSGPSSRIVRIDARGRIRAIGYATDRSLGSGGAASFPSTKDEHAEATPRYSSYELASDMPRGKARSVEGSGEARELYDHISDSFRGVAAPGSSPPPSAPNSDAQDDLRLTLSAKIRHEINLDDVEPLDFRIELSDKALPYDLSISAIGDPSVDLRVVTSIDGTSVRILGKRIQKKPVPDEKAVAGFFEVEAVETGESRISVSFRQGGTELGAMTLGVDVVEELAGSTHATGTATSRSRDPADDDALELLIETKHESVDGRDSIVYEYRLNSQSIGFNYLTVRSAPLLDSGNQPATTIQEYVEGLYKKITQPLIDLSNAANVRAQIDALGVSLCRELFVPAVAEKLWPIRHKLKCIKITTWEPYIPWELIRLVPPDSSEQPDDKFLCEYGLIRTESGIMPPTELSLEQWSYLAALYPNNLHPPVGNEVQYFEKDLPSQGIVPTPIEATPPAFLEALRKAEFDVLHIACHADSPHDEIEDARLVIGDELAPGAQSRPLEVFPSQAMMEVAYSRSFRERHPLVFLNGCETGRIGPKLTSWGGWPKIFLEAGAGVFVGTSWAVRDRPAEEFSRAFYDALRADKPLFEAANRAREAAKKLGDGSWLAFKVYGHPRARRVDVTKKLADNNQKGVQ